MAFVKLLCKAAELERRKQELDQEKQLAVQQLREEERRTKSLKLRYRHCWLDCLRRIRKVFRRRFTFPEKGRIFRCCYKLRHEGSCENYTLKSVIGFIGGFLITYVFFMFFVFQLNFKFSTATIMCSIFGSILTIGLAFSYKVRCVVFLTLPQLFSKRGRQALLAYAFILAITGPAKNTLNNMGILSESLACGQEQLKAAVKQILEVIKKPFYAIRDAIKAVVKVVKIVVKKIKEILLAIKRVILAIVAVIKSVFEFLAKIINVCNKELGTPFQRCTRVFENAITDCHAKLGPVFSWLCSITYLAQTVCYIVKVFDYVCMLVDFISNSIVGVVVKKIRIFVRHIKTMFYVRIRFSHSFHFETNASKSLQDVATGIVTEIKERTEGLMKVFDFMSCATSLFFMFIIFRVLYYRYKFLTDERFDNRFITKDFRAIDMRRAQMGKETVLPLNQRERNVYISVGSCRLVKKEKLQLTQSAMVLGTASLKLATHMMADYALFWVLLQIRRHGSFQSTFTGSNKPTLYVKGEGLLADLLRSIVKAFQPVGLNLEIDTIPCLPDPIPPDYDRYIQIGSLLVICWLLMMFEPFGLRWRHSVMCFYHPHRAKERSIWLYNHILRTRSSFLKFARRQLRRKFKGDPNIAKITCKEFLKANLLRYRTCRLCLDQDKQMYCLLCGEVFRAGEAVKPIRCQTPNCPGIYCENCFQDLQNLCTVCLDPIQYGDLSDISEEKDSSDLESGRIIPGDASEAETIKATKKRKCKLLWCCRKMKPPIEYESDDSDTGPLLGISSPTPMSTPSVSDSDYYSTDTDLSYSYQYKKDVTEKAPEPPRRIFVDIERQRLPDYASMDAFRDSSPESQLEERKPVEMKDESESSEPLFGYEEKFIEDVPLLDLRSVVDEATIVTTTSGDVQGKRKKKIVRLQTGQPIIFDKSDPAYQSQESKRGYLITRRFWRNKKKAMEKGRKKLLMKDVSTSTCEEEVDDNVTTTTIETPSTEDTEMKKLNTEVPALAIKSENDMVFLSVKEEETSSETSTETSSETSSCEIDLRTKILSRPSKVTTSATESFPVVPLTNKPTAKIPLLGKLGIKRKRKQTISEEIKNAKRDKKEEGIEGRTTATIPLTEKSKKYTFGGKRAIQKSDVKTQAIKRPEERETLLQETKETPLTEKTVFWKSLAKEKITSKTPSFEEQSKVVLKQRKPKEEASEETTTTTETPLTPEILEKSKIATHINDDLENIRRRRKVYFDESLPAKEHSLKIPRRELHTKLINRRNLMKRLLYRKISPKSVLKSVYRRKRDVPKGKASESTQTDSNLSDTSPESAPQKNYKEPIPTILITTSDVSSETELGTKESPTSPKHLEGSEERKEERHDANKTKEKTKRKSLSRQYEKFDPFVDIPVEDERDEEKKNTRKKKKHRKKSSRKTQIKPKFGHVGELCADILQHRAQQQKNKLDTKIVCMNQACSVKLKPGMIPKLNLNYTNDERKRTGKRYNSSTTSSSSLIVTSTNSSAESDTCSITSKTSVNIPPKKKDKKKATKKKKRGLHRELSESNLCFAHQDHAPYQRKYGVYYFTESETPRSVRSVTFSPRSKLKKTKSEKNNLLLALPREMSSTGNSSNTSVTILTSPNSQTLISQSPMTNQESPYYTLNYLYNDDFKGTARQNVAPCPLDSPSNTMKSDVKSYKTKARTYYNKLKTKHIDNPPTPKDHQTKFGQFIRRLLRKKNFESVAPKPKSVSSESCSLSQQSSKYNQRGSSASTNVFYNFLMGASLAAQNQQSIKEVEDEPFVFVDTPDRFGLYDSTDTEISELRYPIKEPPVIKDTSTKPINKEGRTREIRKKLVTSPISKYLNESERISLESSSPKRITKLITSPIIKDLNENERTSLESTFEKVINPVSKRLKEDKGINFDSVSGDLSESGEIDATSTIDIEERFFPSRIISVGERRQSSRVLDDEDEPYISSVENRFSGTTQEEISSNKEDPHANEETSSKNTSSTRGSEETHESSYKKLSEVDYRASAKSRINKKKNRLLTYKNTNLTVQQPLTRQSNHDNYYTPELATNEASPHKNEIASTKASAPPNSEEVIKYKGTNALSQVPTIKKGERLREREIPEEGQIEKVSEDEQSRSFPPVSQLNKSVKKKLSRLLGLQMSNDRRRSSLETQDTKYSREPPERDQSYDNSLMKKNQPQTFEVNQGGKPWCSCKNVDDCRRLNHHRHQYSRQTYPEYRKRTTYDLVKSAENLRQQSIGQTKNACACPIKSKQSQQSQSSPEVSNQNKQNMKSQDPCSPDICEYYNDYPGKNEGQMDHVKSRKYPYEEPIPDEHNNENHERNCACDHCNRRNRYRNCKCCNCVTRNDDNVSTYSDDSQCNLNLAYQKSDDYPNLVDEIENSISRRNKERVKKTMRQFEMLSRQNKGLEKPIYDDDEEEINTNHIPCNKRTCPTCNNRPQSKEAQYYNNQNPRPPCYCDRRNYQTKSVCLSERPMFTPTPFPQTRGYVEKVARYMDPSMQEAAQKYPRYRREFSNGRWQMDPRSGEWVKVSDDIYDFENNYPPLPAPPSQMYREGESYRDCDNYHKTEGNPAFFNAPSSYRTQGAFKRANTPTKQCQCRNCMQPPNNDNRY